jgi:hypothetical protein
MMSAAPRRNFAIAALPVAIPVNPKIAAITEMMAKMIAHLIIGRSFRDAAIFRVARVFGNRRDTIVLSAEGLQHLATDH